MKSEKTATDKEVLNVFVPPFHFERDTWLILDSKKTQVMQIRGWSALLRITDPDTAAAIQDKFGEMTAEALNEKYYKPKPNSPFKPKKT